jgi:Cu-Zn family superoxide dismutase
VDEIILRVNRSGGTAIVIHAGADDYRSDLAGNAGARSACGVVKAAP